MLKPEDHERVRAAVAAAEAKTAGDIVCVVARESARYSEVPLGWAAIAALVAPPVALLAGLRPGMVVDRLQGGWTLPRPGGIDEALATGAGAYAVAQIALFVIVLVIVAIPPVRRALTPGFTKRQHVHARALELAAHRRHIVGAPASVLIYASAAERRVEILADDAIHAKVGDTAWNEALAAALKAIRGGDAAAGLVAAVERCGAALAEHFPSDGKARPEPDDEVTEVS